jgi:two-component system, chemotaxis family, chemotaxis protein CheY
MIGGSVLVVDDNDDIREVLGLALEQEGYVVMQAENGRAALEVVARGMPALILLDMKMPVMNGWEFAAELRRTYAGSAPIVVISAAEDARRRAMEIGAQGWVAKPFELGDLLEIVRRNLA